MTLLIQLSTVIKAPNWCSVPTYSLHFLIFNPHKKRVIILYIAVDLG